MRHPGWLLLCLAAWAPACAPARVGPPPAAPPLSEPTDAIPADLDLVVRLDLGKMRRALPLAQLGALGSGIGSDGLVERALEHADTVWIALRPEAGIDQADNVLVLRGDFARFDPRHGAVTPAFAGPRDLGGGWRLYEREAPKSRAAPARVYARLEDLIVFVSTAEIDSTERALEKKPGKSALVPPARGAVSLAARAAPVTRWVSSRLPSAAAVLRRATRLGAHADLSAAGLEAELDVEFDSEDDARAAADNAGTLARTVGLHPGLIGRVARQLHIESIGARLVIRLALDDRELSELVGSLPGRPLGPRQGE